MATRKIEYRYPSATKLCDINANLWLPDCKPFAILQIAHGMAEHIERYEDFAAFLNARNILVAAHDHAGHGRSIGAARGYFGENDGWKNVVEDIRQLRDYLSNEYPALPIILFGHSMGSFLARSYAARYPDHMQGFIFSGTAGKNPAVAAGRVLAKMEIRRNGPVQPSARLHSMSFGSYNKSFRPNRTPSDWLSTDVVQVDKYENDPLCGFTFTAEGMMDLFGGLQEIVGKRWAKKVPSVPILLFSGTDDPVGSFGKGVLQVKKWLDETGHQVTCILYPNGRHEMLNEVNKEAVYEDIYKFVKGII